VGQGSAMCSAQGQSSNLGAEQGLGQMAILGTCTAIPRIPDMVQCSLIDTMLHTVPLKCVLPRTAPEYNVQSTPHISRPWSSSMLERHAAHLAS
jgi:hypothetical protein